MEENDYSSSPKKPNHMRPEFYCATCLSVVSEMMKQVYSSKAEHDVSPAMDTVCHFKDFQEKPYEMDVLGKSYTYRPNQLMLGCMSLVESYEEEMEKFFMSRNTHDVDQLQNLFCGGSF